MSGVQQFLGVNLVSRHEEKKSALLFSNNFTNILYVFLDDVICIILVESMLVNQNLQLSFQPFLVAVTLVEISKTSKDEIQGLSRT